MGNNTFANLQFGEQNEKLTIRCFVELAYYTKEKLQGIKIEQLIECGYCRKEKSMIVFQLTGFLMIDDILVVVFPKGYHLPIEFSAVMEQIRILAGVLFRYKEEGKLTPEEQNLLSGSESGAEFGLAPALWLMNDYLKRGIIQKEKRVQTSGKGTVIDWTRTVNKVIPIISNKNSVYLDYIVKKKSTDYGNILIQLHRLAVKKSFRLYGWLLDKTSLEAEIPDPVIHISQNESAFMLNRELSLTNNDSEIKLIKMIQQFLIGKTGDTQSIELNTFATPYFHNVWEKICGFLFNNEYTTLKGLVPNPVWFWGDKQKSMVQIPDILYQYHEKFYILDAKYYDTNKTLPGWHDLVKQYFYAYSLKEAGSDYVNVMVFPTVKPHVLTREGYSLIPGRNDLGRIEAVGLNTYYALKNYADYKNSDLRSILESLLYNKKET